MGGSSLFRRYLFCCGIPTIFWLLCGASVFSLETAWRRGSLHIPRPDVHCRPGFTADLLRGASRHRRSEGTGSWIWKKGWILICISMRELYPYGIHVNALLGNPCLCPGSALRPLGRSASITSGVARLGSGWSRQVKQCSVLFSSHLFCTGHRP